MDNKEIVNALNAIAQAIVLLALGVFFHGCWSVL